MADVLFSTSYIDETSILRVNTRNILCQTCLINSCHFYKCEPELWPFQLKVKLYSHLINKSKAELFWTTEMLRQLRNAQTTYV